MALTPEYGQARAEAKFPIQSFDAFRNVGLFVEQVHDLIPVTCRFCFPYVLREAH
jgi:hypothetical protein